MRFWCSVCNQPIEDGDVIFICRGFAYEPVPDRHERMRAMHERCAEKIGFTVKYPIYITEEGELKDEG